MSNTSENYYAFGQVADRMIQVTCEQGGRLKAELRRQQSFGGWSAFDAGGATIPDDQIPFYTAKDATRPVTIEFAVLQDSWGCISHEPVGWEIRYRMARTGLLGYRGEPFGKGANYFGAHQAANARLETKELYTFQADLIRSDPAVRTYSHEIRLAEAYHGAGDRALYCLMLRLCNNNVGVVTLGNVSTPDGTLVLTSRR